ncbi:MAG: DoxX family protein [Mycobacterium sp.]
MTSPPPELQQIVSPVPAYRLAALLLGVGTTHFLMPKPFDDIIPAELPGSPRLYTYASGVAELTTGALSPASGRCPQLAPRTRKLGAAAAVAVFLGVFPGNINMVRLWWDRPWPMRLAAIARLPLQIPMISTALKVYRST